MYAVNTKQKSKVILYILFGVFFLFAVIILIFFRDHYDTFMFYNMLYFLAVVIYVGIHYRKELTLKTITTSDIRKWAEQRGFVYEPESTTNNGIRTLLEASTSKSYFNFKKVFQERRDPFQGFWSAETKKDGRRIVIFSSVAGWCVDIQTNVIPVFVRVMDRFFNAPDKLHVESNTFEKRYDINVHREGAVLQLLDPVMIDILNNAHIAGVEFGDSSIVLYLTFLNRLSDFDWMVEWGLKIAHQVDHNFPLGKYEKV